MRNEDLDKDLEGLYDLMEQQIAGYRHLLEEVKRVSRHLRPVSAEALIVSIKDIGEETDRLLHLGKRTEGKIGEILSRRGRAGEESSLTSLLGILPPVHHRRIGLYQRTLKRLRRWVEEVNGRNRVFVAESLSFVKQFLSLFMEPMKGSAVYAKDGQKRSLAFSPSSLDRRVE